MSQICNGFLEFENPATEALKNREIELGSAALFRAASASMLALSAVEDGSRNEISNQLDIAISHLDTASTHYNRVASLVVEADMAERYRNWLEEYDFAALLAECVESRSLPSGSEHIWGVVSAYNAGSADPKGAYLNEFLPRVKELGEVLDGLQGLVHDDFTVEVSPSLIPKEFWKLQTVLHETMQVGQSIAIMNALDMTSADS
ncbi:hypothetical protein [Brachybacterium timonense]|uniref:hypothetical protein n=1 Tax=Brachybacterium timonense TaxID=2050896 RepID=UPI000D0ADE38|nr:hypothetical protein [Brachybacterium timonense]